MVYENLPLSKLSAGSSNAHAYSPKDIPQPRVLQTEHFLKGPIPLRWIQLASRAGKSALVVGIILWYRRGLLKRESVDLNLSGLGPYGLNRHTASRGLKRLETSGLAIVERFKGRKSIVRILQIKPTKTESSK